jgi:O-antigen/teichoic acid export membrane protein
LNKFKQLAGQTAIYGLSSIIGRFINVLLVPIYTRVFDVGEYGVVTQLYAYAAFFNILFVFGLDTAFFKFMQSEKDKSKVYTTGLLSILVISIFFALLIFIFSGQIAAVILNGNSIESLYVKLFAGILACDAITAIPFAKLRQENNARRFAILRLVNIFLNVSFNIFFLVLCPMLMKNDSFRWIGHIYDPSMGVGYVFISGLLSSFITLLMLSPEIIGIPMKLDSEMLSQMLIYSFPLMIAGFAGMINETFDRILIPILIKEKSEAIAQLGVYGACYKLSIIMTLFIQTFRYAAEPFFFSHSTSNNPQRTYAQVMNYFVIVCSLIFLGVMLYIDLIIRFIGPNFRSGVGVVPILLLANLCLGVYYNLSIWYKLTSKTRWGAWLSVFGAAVTLLFNFILIPVMGYMGAAWATLICYALMMILSYYIGQKYYPVPYNVSSFLYYVLLAIIFWRISLFIHREFEWSAVTNYALNTLILILFAVMIWISERRKINYLRGNKNQNEIS